MNAKRILISLAGIAVCCGVILAANYGLGPVAQQLAGRAWRTSDQPVPALPGFVAMDSGDAG